MPLNLPFCAALKAKAWLDSRAGSSEGGSPPGTADPALAPAAATGTLGGTATPGALTATASAFSIAASEGERPCQSFKCQLFGAAGKSLQTGTRSTLHCCRGLGAATASAFNVVAASEGERGGWNC